MKNRLEQTETKTRLLTCVHGLPLACLQASREEVTVKVLNHIPIPREYY